MFQLYVISLLLLLFRMSRICMQQKNIVVAYFEHGIALVRCPGESDVSIVRRFYPKLYLPGCYRVELVFKLVLGRKC